MVPASRLDAAGEFLNIVLQRQVQDLGAHEDALPGDFSAGSDSNGTGDQSCGGAQLGMDARRTISFPVVSMNSLDIAQEFTIGDLARALGP